MATLRIEDFPRTARQLDGIEVLQWVPVRYAEANAQRGRLHESLKGTWGPGTYVAMHDRPLSAVHYGQAALRATLSASRVFDATLPENVLAFLRWTGTDVPAPWWPPARMSRPAYTFFRSFLEPPDAVVFHPDEFCPHTRTDDCWVLVPPWAATRLDAVEPALASPERFAPGPDPRYYARLDSRWFVDPDGPSLTIQG